MKKGGDKHSHGISVIAPQEQIEIQGARDDHHIHMDMMVVLGPLDFNMLLGCGYTYAMGVLISSPFRVVCFPHEGRIVTIDQLSFFGLDVAVGLPSSLPGF